MKYKNIIILIFSALAISCSSDGGSEGSGSENNGNNNGNNNTNNFNSSYVGNGHYLKFTLTYYTHL